MQNDVEKLIDVLKEYLQYKSLDGKPIRQELRKELDNLVNKLELSK